MISNLHTVFNNITVKLLLIVILITFGLTGVINNYLLGIDNDDYAVSVNGYKISRLQIKSILDNDINQLWSTSDESTRRDIYFYVLQQIIINILLHQYVEKLKFSVSDYTIKQFILNEENFQVNGSFDNATYKNKIAQMGLTVDQYIKLLRARLSMQNLLSSITNSDFILKSESEKILNLSQQKRNFRTAALSIDKLIKAQHISDSDILSYYKNNMRLFLQPEKFLVSYILLDVANVKEPIVSELEIKNWYNQNKDEYLQIPLNHYRIIQTQTKYQANLIIKKLINGENFALLAKKYSIDPLSNLQGGDLGWVEPARIPEELKKANLTKIGQISDPIKLSVGFIIAKLEGIQRKHVKSITEVRDTIVNQIIEQKKLTYLSQLQQKIVKAIENHANISQIEKLAKIKVVKTNWFNLNNIPAEFNNESVKNSLLNIFLEEKNKANKSINIIGTDDYTTFIAKLDGYTPQTTIPLKDVKNKIVSYLKYNQAIKQAKIQGQKIVEDLNVGKYDSFKKAKLHFGKLQVTDINTKDLVSQKVFTIPKPEKGKRYELMDDSHGHIILIALDKVFTDQGNTEQYQKIIKNIDAYDRTIIINTLLQALYEKAKIKYGKYAM